MAALGITSFQLFIHYWPGSACRRQGFYSHLYIPLQRAIFGWGKSDAGWGKSLAYLREGVKQAATIDVHQLIYKSEICIVSVH